ncbi:Pre-mRNA-splicing factor CWC22 [Wallemia ichthyophaga EXF-994]|uniref:Pre-mRNA-splicing factor CWC22 n=1 Tax=Wallemia ichthyophaga (strain EXF-994 / CBS 113033) TaxID=1299270 RepID=R9AHK8_WALI9|nr:Pre-mRNA-splicing factor CWC22 [Wallemia ichthyophaga EXF-994]EOR01673.1 Pre-mRNA-splicing factor CWC22 [Wallemia ichthyophaga EXF-994]
MSTTETPELKRKRSTSPNTHQQHKPINLNNELSTLGLNRPTGRYIPRPVLKAMLEQQSLDSSSADTQRLKWDQLRKSINGLINKVNTGNIKLISPQLFQENLIRGRGLFARSVIRAQSSSLPFTPIFAALVAIINSKLPQLGELLVQRLINQFRKSYRRNDKLTCNATVIFIAHLVNQSVISDVFALELALFLLSKGGDDGVEIAVQYIREVGAALQEREPAMNNLIYEELRNLLHDANISKRVQYMIEVLFQIRKDKFKDNVIIPQDLDLVEEDEQIVHDIDFNAPINTQDGLNIFKFDPNYEENEEKYASIRHQILGSSDEEEEEEEEEEGEEENDAVQPPNQDGIVDHTGTNLVNLRRTIYLTIMNSLVFDEAVHKLMRIQIPPGDEIELCNMIVECCSQERTYNKFYGLIGERFSKINRMWQECFQKSFTGFYDTIHRYETNRLRNIARFFGHLFASDGVNWGCMNVIKITQQDTTSSSRIFVKILFNEIVEMMGLSDARKRFADPAFRQDFSGLFPTDHPANTRFAINYFTAIGLGAITEEMREYLKHAPKNIPPPQTHDDGSGSDSDSSSVLSSSSSDVSSVSAGERDRYRPRSRSRSRSLSRSPRRPRSYSRSPSRSPPRRYTRSVSSSPPRRRYGGGRTSRSPSPRRRYDNRHESMSPPPSPRRRPYAGRGGYELSRSPPRRRYDDSPAGRRNDSPPRRRYDSPPRRRYDSPPRRRYDSPPRRWRG